MLYEFELGYIAMEATNNICHAKDEGAVDLIKVTRWLKKFCSNCKNFDDHAQISGTAGIVNIYTKLNKNSFSLLATLLVIMRCMV